MAYYDSGISAQVCPGGMLYFVPPCGLSIGHLAAGVATLHFLPSCNHKAIEWPLAPDAAGGSTLD